MFEQQHKSYVDIDNTMSAVTARPNPARCLGAALFLSAIADYRSLDNELHRDAAALLYPSTLGQWKLYEWALSETKGTDPDWLRENLDFSRPTWDRERAERLLADPQVLTRKQAELLVKRRIYAARGRAKARVQ